MKKYLLIFFILFFSFRAGAETEPGKDFYSAFLAGAVYETENQPKKALEFYNKALKLYPESQYLKTAVLAAALKTGEQKNYADVAREVSAYDDVKSLTAYAQYSWTEGRLKDAEQYYRKAIDLNSDNTALIMQYLTLLKGVDTEGAVSFLEEYAKKYPEIAASFYHEAGNTYLAKKETAKALEMYQKASAADGRFVPARMAKADIYKHEQNLSAALKEYKAVEAAGRADNEVFLQAGILEILLKNLPAAKKYFNRILETAPRHALANQFLAAIAEDAKDFQNARKFLSSGEDFDTNPQKEMQAAFYSARLGDKETASDYLKLSYQNSGKGVESGYFYAVSLQDLERHEEAAKVFKEILAKNPDLDKARLLYCVSLEETGDVKETEKQMKILIKKMPDNPAVLNGLGYSMIEQNKNLEEAKGYVEKALSLNPGDPAATDSLGWYYFKKKNYAEAEQYLLPAYKASGGDAEIAGHLGMLYYKKKDYAKAAEFFKISGKQKYSKYLKAAEAEK